MLDNLHAMDEDNRRAVLGRLASPFKLRVTDGDTAAAPLTLEQVQARMIELLTPMGAADRLIAISKLAEPFEGVEVTFNGGAYKIDTKARAAAASPRARLNRRNRRRRTSHASPRPWPPKCTVARS